MNIIDCFRGEKMSQNVYADIEVAWAEYEYICSTIKTKIFEIINNDFVLLTDEYGVKDEGYVDVEVKNATVIVTLKPGILTSTIRKVEDFLGIEGKVMISGTKKNARIKLIFFNVNTENLDKLDE